LLSDLIFSPSPIIEKNSANLPEELDIFSFIFKILKLSSKENKQIIIYLEV
jgi:hypothetical protein